MCVCVYHNGSDVALESNHFPMAERDRSVISTDFILGRLHWKLEVPVLKLTLRTDTRKSGGGGGGEQ